MRSSSFWRAAPRNGLAIHRCRQHHLVRLKDILTVTTAYAGDYLTKRVTDEVQVWRKALSCNHVIIRTGRHKLLSVDHVTTYANSTIAIGIAYHRNDPQPLRAALYNRRPSPSYINRIFNKGESLRVSATESCTAHINGNSAILCQCRLLTVVKA